MKESQQGSEQEWDERSSFLIATATEDAPITLRLLSPNGSNRVSGDELTINSLKLVFSGGNIPPGEAVEVAVKLNARKPPKCGFVGHNGSALEGRRTSPVRVLVKDVAEADIRRGRAVEDKGDLTLIVCEIVSQGAGN